MKKVAAKAEQLLHHPASFAIVHNWIQVGVDNIDQALLEEAHSIAVLMMGNTSRQLVRVFFLTRAIKNFC